jgi:hypothetical protein
MQIRLYNYAVIASNLTYEQVEEAVAKANASEAGQHFQFYRHTLGSKESIRRWSLLAMPRIYQDRMRDGADDSGWWIEIGDG